MDKPKVQINPRRDPQLILGQNIFSAIVDLQRSYQALVSSMPNDPNMLRATEIAEYHMLKSLRALVLLRRMNEARK